MKPLNETQQAILACLPPEPHTARLPDIAMDVFGADNVQTRRKVGVVIRHLEERRGIRMYRQSDYSGGRPRFRYGISCAWWPDVEEWLKDWGTEENET